MGCLPSDSTKGQMEQGRAVGHTSQVGQQLSPPFFLSGDRVEDILMFAVNWSEKLWDRPETPDIMVLLCE